MALLYKRRVFAAAVETTPGTPVALSTANTMFCFDPVIQGAIPMHERVASGSLSKLPAIPGLRKGKITFSVELSGGGTAIPPPWAVLLTCCGMVATSNVYTFTSNPTNYSTCTVGIYEGGRYKVLAGCQGTWSLEGEAGKPGMIKFELEGVWQPPVDSAFIALPSYLIVPPRFAAATFTLGGFQPKISKFSLESGNVIHVIEDVTQIAGVSRAIITDRSVKGKIDPLGELVGTWDAYGLWLAGTTAALSVVIGTATDNTITIAAPAIQTQNVQEAQREGLITDDQDFIATSVSTGDAELSITFS